MFLNLFKKYWKDLFFIVLLVGLSFYAWRFLLDWIIQFAGFEFLDPRRTNTYLSNPGFLSIAEVAGVFLGSILLKLVGVNMPLYMWIQLTVMLSIGVLFYFVVKVVTKNRFIAFSAALIFTVNYFGNYEMSTASYSNHFLERASVNVIFLLLSFLFLHIFLEKTKQKYYIISLTFYFLGILSSHFSILFTGPYFFYPFFWYLFNKKNALKGFAIGISYVLISGFFIYIQSIGIEPVLGTHESFLQFMLKPQKYHYPEKMFMQLIYWSQYPNIIKAMLSGMSPLSVFEYASAALLKSPIAITYIGSALIIYKALPKRRAVLLTAILGTASIFLLNIYLGRQDQLYSAGASRYLYFPTYLLAIFWSLFLWALFKNKNIGLKIIAIIILTGYYIFNNYLLFFNFSRDYTAIIKSEKAIFNHIINTRNKLKPNTLVIGPYPELAGQYEAPFFTYQLGRGEVTYMVDTFNVTDWRTVAPSSSHIIQLKYNNKCSCVLEEKIK